ncbi:DNA double-strand break repair protein Rad50, partial ['Crotalaria aegyptiaca' phytoplasma]|nr:DNA double-strand break repair protein Rad50 ['Crotalaria aegyptiaca' phytoplasma]
MLSPLDLLKSYFTFKSYFTWFLLASFLFSGFLFIKKKYNPLNAAIWKGYLMPFLIILGCLSFIYLSFFHQPKEPSSKNYGQLISKIDQAITQYDQTINNFHGLKKDWEKELDECEKELKDLYEQKDLTQEAKEKIKEALEKNEDKIKEIKENLDQNDKNITILKGKLVQLEKDKETKEKEIKGKERQKELASSDEKIRLEAEIEKLKAERLEIIGEIGKINVQIGKLEVDQKSYQEMLTRAQNSKKRLEKEYKILNDDEKRIFDFTKIKEARHAEIQKNIDEINEKITLIGMEREQLKILLTGADAAKAALDDWDKRHEFSFGNLS